jgi:hypothetical protein
MGEPQPPQQQGGQPPAGGQQQEPPQQGQGDQGGQQPQQQQAQGDQGGQQGQGGDDAAQLRRDLAASRRDTEAARRELAKLKSATQTEQEKAVEKAREEGKAEAVKAAGVRVAAAEFRAAAIGKLADPGAVLKALDLRAFVNDEGEPDTKGIAQLVADLAAATTPAQNGGGRVPPGPRQPAPEGDFWRSVMPRQQGGHG